MVSTPQTRRRFGSQGAAELSAAMERGSRATQSMSSPQMTDMLRANYHQQADPEDNYFGQRELMRLYRRRMATEFSTNELKAKLGDLIRGPRPRVESFDLHPMIRTILDSTGGTTGNVLPRVDIEQVIYSLFLKRFPYWDRIDKQPANGLKHTWNVKTSVGALTDATLTLATEVTAATEDVSAYAQDQMSNIAIMATIRGASLKEIFVVQQSGMSYNPENEEMASGATNMAKFVQKLILQGNQSVSGGAGAATEKGAYNSVGFDGLRLITGGYGTYNSPAVSTVTDSDVPGSPGPFDLTQAVNYQTAQMMEVGADPTILMMSPIAYQKLMNEQEGKQRSNDRTSLVPGLMVPAITTTAGILPTVIVPGGANGIGTYNRAGDSVLVEDLYCLSEDYVHWRYLGSPDVTVIEIPTGVDAKLTRRFIMFLMGGVQIADNGYWQGKIRIPR